MKGYSERDSKQPAYEPQQRGRHRHHGHDLSRRHANRLEHSGVVDTFTRVEQHRVEDAHDGDQNQDQHKGEHHRFKDPEGRGAEVGDLRVQEIWLRRLDASRKGGGICAGAKRYIVGRGFRVWNRRSQGRPVCDECTA